MRSKRKKRVIEEESQGWLMSYADMMTLIAGFFILMMAFANYDPVGFTKVVEEVRKHFNKDKYKSSMTKMDEISEEVSLHPELKKVTKISQIDNELLIAFEGSALFAQGDTSLKEAGFELLDSMITIIKAKDPNYKILIEGYADDFQFTQNQDIIRSNWSLAAIRASQVVSRFEYFGFDPLQLSAVSFGDATKNKENEEEVAEMGEAYLRRVVVKVIEPPQKGRSIKMGLGVYFKDL